VSTKTCSTCRFWSSDVSDREIDDEAECDALQATDIRTVPRSARVFTSAGFSCAHYEQLRDALEHSRNLHRIAAEAAEFQGRENAKLRAALARAGLKAEVTQ
jgi:hypothetical protein